jgi:hypothetical protein
MKSPVLFGEWLLLAGRDDFANMRNNDQFSGVCVERCGVGEEHQHRSNKPLLM